MAVNPLDAIVGFVLKFIFSILMGFVGVFFFTLIIGNVGTYLVAIITSTPFQVYSVADATILLNAALEFFLGWMPHIWYMFQWVLWILTAGQLFPYPTPVW